MVTSLRKLMSTSETNMPAPWQKKVPMLCQSRLRNLGLAICILDQKIDVKVFWRSLGGGRFFLLSFLDFLIEVVQVWVGGPCPGYWLGSRVMPVRGIWMARGRMFLEMFLWFFLLESVFLVIY
jgi:hypothetical protein